MKSVTTAGRCAGAVIASGLLLAAAGCGDSTPVGLAGRATGVLQVTVSTTGAGLPSNGYTVSVDSGAGQPVPVNGKVSLAGLSAGYHSVTMYGAPPNCALSGANTRAVDVLAGDTVLVAFEVACTSVAGASGQIAFVSDRDGNDEIYVINADGSSPTRLTNNAATDFEPAWSPNAQKIAFTSQRDDAHYYEIYVMEADGSHPTRLTNNPGENLAPAWSPDGKRIAFTSMGEVYVMNADGSSPTRLTYSPPDWDWAGEAAWSPDGSKIALTRASTGPYCDPDGLCSSVTDYVISIMNADGTGIHNLASGSGAAWSPDGTRIAFRGDGGINVRNADGSSGRQVIAAIGGIHLAWSPDGAKIAFDGAIPYYSGAQWDIYVMNADGSGVVRLTQGAGNNYLPAWRP